MSYITKSGITAGFKMVTGFGTMQTECGVVDVTPFLFAIVDASAHETRTRTQWLDTARIGWLLGIRADMVTPRIPDGDKLTKKGKPQTRKNPGCQMALYESMIQANLAGISVSRPPVQYKTARPDAPGADVLAGKASAFTWTAMECANCPTAYLVGSTDSFFKGEREHFKSWAGGSYMSRMQGYLLDLEFPDRKTEARAARTAAADAAADAAVDAATSDAPFLDRMVGMLQEFNATVLGMKGSNGQTLSGVIAAQEAGLELLARIGQMK